MTLHKEFFAGLGSLVCSMTLGGGELSPIEKELILETADGIFQDGLSATNRRQPPSWRSMFSDLPNLVADPDPRAVFWRWMRNCDAQGWAIPQAWGKKLVKFIQSIAEVYGLSSPDQAAMVIEFLAELKHRSGN